MAAIDKIYVKDIQQYDEFADWCRKQPRSCGSTLMKVTVMTDTTISVSFDE
jgi:hypothetical protein